MLTAADQKKKCCEKNKILNLFKFNLISESKQQVQNLYEAN